MSKKSACTWTFLQFRVQSFREVWWVFLTWTFLQFQEESSREVCGISDGPPCAHSTLKGHLLHKWQRFFSSFLSLRDTSFIKWHFRFMLGPISRHISKTYHTLEFSILWRKKTVSHFKKHVSRLNKKTGITLKKTGIALKKPVSHFLLIFLCDLGPIVLGKASHAPVRFNLYNRD